MAEPDTTVAVVLTGLAGRRFESAAYVVVCSGAKLVGLARLEDLLAAAAATPIRDLMDPDPPVIEHGVDEEVAAWKAVRHGECALAVVDKGDLVGLIPPRRMVEVLLTGHDEDLARLGGYLASTSSARHATEEGVGARLLHRLPWLVLGLVGSIAAAGVVGAAEGQLSRSVLLAFFIPGIVYMADAVGTQTEAVVIRGLSVGVPIARIVGRELVTGLFVGTSLASIFFPVCVLVWGDADVAMAVSIALLAACSTASVVAMALPWVFDRLGHDPASVSGLDDGTSAVVMAEDRPGGCVGRGSPAGRGLGPGPRPRNASRDGSQGASFSTSSMS